jgi:Recombination endonuclease VII
MLEIVNSQRKCTKCKEWLPTNDYYPDKRHSTGLDPWCRRCHFEKKLRHRYRLTPDQYDAMLLSQGGTCQICKQPPTSKRLSVDHDHACCSGEISCGKCVRGLLCDKCNWWLGLMEDDLEMLVSAESYLRRYKNVL